MISWSHKFMDDIIFGGQPPVLIANFVEQIKSEFKMSMVGELSFYLDF